MKLFSDLEDVSMNEWIDATEKLPTDDGTYFARCYGMDQMVSHWLPIPPFQENK